ncbi:MAG: hypothetical protein IGS03_10730 [Candidatus Sericytochromatia bacterium]|nr:hypothetical protein [Candidatus Sericytochromatia bacterium]
MADRIGFLPWMTLPQFKQVLAASDRVLDSLHFGGGTTCRLMLNLGLHYITLPGAFGRGRYGLAGYKALGITEPVAESPEVYRQSGPSGQ